ncbi:unnamed protein product [Trichobilharzia regenti]|uniref:Kinesin motor domain-containing protein n=1 Tax=Trichobilharzia regenti TaxID=157069 RepID=A0A183WJX1_TRIRE|nr:unnamed protein product [Trichobilharzia regenti]VDQ08306.1 unnamed protein product [Trichobilharzia regenti]
MGNRNIQLPQNDNKNENNKGELNVKYARGNKLNADNDSLLQLRQSIFNNDSALILNQNENIYKHYYYRPGLKVDRIISRQDDDDDDDEHNNKDQNGNLSDSQEIHQSRLMAKHVKRATTTTQYKSMNNSPECIDDSFNSKLTSKCVFSKDFNKTTEGTDISANKTDVFKNRLKLSQGDLRQSDHFEPNTSSLLQSNNQLNHCKHDLLNPTEVHTTTTTTTSVSDNSNNNQHNTKISSAEHLTSSTWKTTSDETSKGRFNKSKWIYDEEELAKSNNVNLDFIYENLQKELAILSQKHKELLDMYNNSLGNYKKLKDDIENVQSSGLKLEEANGKFITESVKHKYLQMEIKQLDSEIHRHKSILNTKELEKLQLFKELERIRHQKSIYQRQYQLAVLESNITVQQLHEMSTAYSLIEMSEKSNQVELQKRLNNVQLFEGRFNVVLLLKPTVHESCIQCLSDTEILFQPPVHQETGDKTSNNTVGSKPVICHLSKVISSGLCNPLELYAKYKSLLDLVPNGLKKCFISVGPYNTGKSSTLFGNAELFTKDTEFKDTPNISQLLHCTKFAKNYGFLGLSLVRLLQNVQFSNYTSDSDFDEDNCITGNNIHREFQNSEHSMNKYRKVIHISIVEIPIASSDSEIDGIINQPIKLQNDNTAKSISNNEFTFMHHLKQYSVKSMHDILSLLTIIRKRRHQMKSNAFHRLVIIRVGSDCYHPSLTEKLEKCNNGFLIFLDTTGLKECNSAFQYEPNDESIETLNIIKTWKDIASVAQLFYKEYSPNRNCSTRVSWWLEPFLNEKCSNEMNGDVKSKVSLCTLLIHLPCDKSYSKISMQCLKFGIWVLKLNQRNHSRNESNSYDNNNYAGKKISLTTKSTSPQSYQKCVWKIGSVGYEKPKSNYILINCHNKSYLSNKNSGDNCNTSKYRRNSFKQQNNWLDEEECKPKILRNSTGNIRRNLSIS